MVYLVTINDVVQLDADTTLYNSCMRYNIPYYQAHRGKRLFKVGEDTIVLMEINIHKVKGRGKKRW